MRNSLALSTAALSTPAKTVTRLSGFTFDCAAIFAPGLAFAAAQPQTELTTSKVVPVLLDKTSFTASAVSKPVKPKSVKSLARGATSITLLLPQGCTKDKIVTVDDCGESDFPTYVDVRQILNTSCGASNSNCHIPGGTSPDYTSWNQGMENSLTFERFESRVLIRKDMPQLGSPPLDSLDFQKVKCWVRGGYQQ